jgi:hypothetical protein
MSCRVFATILGIAKTTNSSKTALSPAVMKFRYEAVLEALVAAAANNSFDFSVLLGSSYQSSLIFSMFSFPTIFLKILLAFM